MGYDKAPSAGTKVTLGENAPVRREAAGQVEPDSLAAESYEQGGTFADNRGAAPESTAQGGDGSSSNKSEFTSSSFEPVNKKKQQQTENTFSDNKEQEEPSRTKLNESANTTSSSRGPEIPGNGDTAPSYVENQYIRDSNGPHGRNLHEVEEFEDGGGKKLRDGVRAAFEAEPGSQDDPSRVAERNFGLEGEDTSAGKRKNNGLEGDSTTYDALDSERNI